MGPLLPGNCRARHLLLRTVESGWFFTEDSTRHGRSSRKTQIVPPRSSVDEDTQTVPKPRARYRPRAMASRPPSRCAPASETGNGHVRRSNLK